MISRNMHFVININPTNVLVSFLSKKKKKKKKKVEAWKLLKVNDFFFFYI